MVHKFVDHKFVYHAVFCVYLYPTTGQRTCRDYRRRCIPGRSCFQDMAEPLTLSAAHEG